MHSKLSVDLFCCLGLFRANSSANSSGVRRHIMHQYKSPLNGTASPHINWCRDVTLLGNGSSQVAVSAGHDSSLYVWNTTNGNMIRKLKGHSRGITTLATIPFRLSSTGSTPISSAPVTPIIPAPSAAAIAARSFASATAVNVSIAASYSTINDAELPVVNDDIVDLDGSDNKDVIDSHDDDLTPSVPDDIIIDDNNNDASPAVASPIVQPFFSTHFLTGSYDKVSQLKEENQTSKTRPYPRLC
jgi:WD40 repeat protein